MKNITKFIRKVLQESRMMTYTGEILSLISKSIPGIKRLGFWSMGSGSVGLFRYEKDGNAYEIVIRPVDLGEFKDLYGDLIKKKIERNGFNPNKNEPLALEDVKKLIISSLKPVIHSLETIKNNRSSFGFKVILKNDAKVDEITAGVRALEAFDYFIVGYVDYNSPKKTMTIKKKKSK